MSAPQEDNIAPQENLEELRDFIRELLLKDKNVNEYDAIYHKEADWKTESAELKVKMLQLIDHIENDQYKEGLDAITDTIYLLKVWSNKIKNYLKD